MIRLRGADREKTSPKKLINLRIITIMIEREKERNINTSNTSTLCVFCHY